MRQRVHGAFSTLWTFISLERMYGVLRQDSAWKRQCFGLMGGLLVSVAMINGEARDWLRPDNHDFTPSLASLIRPLSVDDANGFGRAIDSSLRHVERSYPCCPVCREQWGPSWMRDVPASPGVGGEVQGMSSIKRRPAQMEF
nr:hypothetical protein CFP56_12281 [Quercus suber]